MPPELPKWICYALVGAFIFDIFLIIGVGLVDYWRGRLYDDPNN